MLRLSRELGTDNDLNPNREGSFQYISRRKKYRANDC